MPPPDAPDWTAPEAYRGVMLLGALPRDVLAALLARSDLARVPAGTVLIARGASNATLHVLLEGAMEALFDLDRREDPIAIAPGRVFGEMSVLDGEPASAFVVAAAPSLVLLVPAAAFWDALAAAPGAARGAMAALGALLRAGNARILAAAEERLRHAALARDIALAREIQAGMLARPEPWFPGQDRFAIAATIHPAKEVGGDLYEALMLDGDRLLVAVGDVSGKGIGAALFMMRALTLLRATAPGAPDLASLATTLNAGLVAGNEAGMFVTLFLGVLDLRSGVLDAVSCGHGPPLLRDAAGRAAFHGLAPAPPLGLVEGARFATGRIALPPGATLLLSSDGVAEAMNAAGQEFGAESFRAAVEASPNGPPARLLDDVLAAIRAHAGTAPQADDITLLALRWHGESQAATDASGTDAPPL